MSEGPSEERKAPRWGQRRLELPAWLRAVVDGAGAFIILFMTRNLDHQYVFGPNVWWPQAFLEYPEWMSPAHLAWVVASGAVLTVRRLVPMFTSAALPVLLFVHLVALPTTYSAFAVTAFAMFHLGRHCPVRWRRPAWAAVAVFVPAAMLLRGEALVVSWEVALVQTLPALSVLGFFWMWGSNRRRRDQELTSLRDRAELAAIAERTRIAREMHDIVAHSLTAVIAQADGGRFIAAKHPEKAVEALENIASTARDSLGQMRQLLSVLRDPAEDGAVAPLDDGPAPAPSGHAADSAPGASGGGAPGRGSAVQFAPMPGLDALPQLIAESTRAGLRVTFREEGPRPVVGATTQLTIYRIIQESLTNALKHAGHVAVDVRLEWSRRGCTITVRNDAGPGNVEVEASRSGSGAPRIGRGITGMRERVALHGGTLDIDDAPGGYTVTARLPEEGTR